MATTVQQTQQLLDPTIKGAREAIFDALFRGPTPVAKTAVEVPQYERYVAPTRAETQDIQRRILGATGSTGTGIGGYLPFLEGAEAGLTSAQGMISGAGADLAILPGLAQQQADIARQYTTQAAPLLQQGVGSFEEAAELARGATGMYDPSMAAGFRSDFEQAVIDRARQDIARSGDIARRDIAAQAVAQGAYGGSREAVERALTREAEFEQLGDVSERLRLQGEAAAQQQAQQAFEAAQARQMGAGQAIAQTGAQQLAAAGQTQALGAQLAGILGSTAGQRLQAAQAEAQFGQATGQTAAQMAGLAAQRRELAAADLSQALGITQMQQAAEQARLDAELRGQQEQALEPMRRIGFAADIVAGQPAGGTVAQFTQTPETGTSASEYLGTGIALLGAGRAYNPFQQSSQS